MENFIDIIIVNFNSTSYTVKCIGSIYKLIESDKLKVIVIDNASSDYPHRIKEKFPKVQLIINNDNLGYAKAVNMGLKAATSNISVLLNPDTIVCEGFFDKIFHYLNSNTKVAIVGPKILESDGSIQGSARRFPSPLTSIFGRKSPLTRLFPNNSISKREFLCFNNDGEEPVEVDWVSGACMVARKKALDEVCGFDERFFLYWEDTDLCRRLKNNGWKTIYFPQAEVYHHTGTSSDTAPYFSIFNFHKSCYLLFRKYSQWPLKVIMPLALLGLSTRCLLVMGLSFVQQVLNSQKHKQGKKPLQKKILTRERKIKILRIISRFNIGGPSIHCALLLKKLNNERFSSKLITGTLSPYEGDMSYLLGGRNGLVLKIPEIQREINIINDIKALYKTIRILFKEKPDIVHTHLAKAGALSRLAVLIYNFFSRNKIKTVHTYHGHVLEGYFGPVKSKAFLLIEKALAKHTDAIVAISQTQKWEFAEKFKIAQKEKVHVINLGFDLTRFTLNHGNGDFRCRIGVDRSIILIGIVGRLAPIKNHILFLDAAKILKESLSHMNMRFIIIGDGEMRQQLQNYAWKIGLQKNVTFYGWAKNVQQIYPGLDILMLTSLNEGTPVSLIEAMASSVPVVTTGVGGVRDLLGRIENGHQNRNGNGYHICERGIMCPKGSALSIANGVQFLLENDNRKMIEKAQKFVFENYSDNQLVAKMEKLYRSLVL